MAETQPQADTLRFERQSHSAGGQGELTLSQAGKVAPCGGKYSAETFRDTSCDQPRVVGGEASPYDQPRVMGGEASHSQYQQVTWSRKRKKGASPSLAGSPVCGLYEVANGTSASPPAQGPLQAHWSSPRMTDSSAERAALSRRLATQNVPLCCPHHGWVPIL